MPKGPSQSTAGDSAERGHFHGNVSVAFFFDQKKEKISVKHVPISEALLALQLPPVETLTGCQSSIAAP